MDILLGNEVIIIKHHKRHPYTQILEAFFWLYPSFPNAQQARTRKASARDYNFTVHEILPEFEREYQGLQRLEISGL